jgi:hypothetical protein
MLDAMTEGLKSADAGQVREAALKAKQLAGMLTEDASEKVKQAIDVARAGAKRIGKSAELAATEIDKATLDVIARSRTAFLDLTDGAEISEPTHNARSVALAPDDAPEMVAPTMPSLATLGNMEIATIN